RPVLHGDDGNRHSRAGQFHGQRSEEGVPPGELERETGESTASQVIPHLRTSERTSPSALRAMSGHGVPSKRKLPNWGREVATCQRPAKQDQPIRIRRMTWRVYTKGRISAASVTYRAWRKSRIASICSVSQCSRMK